MRDSPASATRLGANGNGEGGISDRVPPPDFVPTRILDVELTSPLADIPGGESVTGTRYGRGRVLARVHGKPLGVVDVDLGEDGLSGVECAQRLWDTLEPEINAHLRGDGLRKAASIADVVAARPAHPRCVEAHARLAANPPRASVIVATHDGPAGLARALSSLAEMDYANFEIIVVDNSPATPSTREVLRRQFSDIGNIRYVVERRRGLTPARMRGVAEADGEIVAFTDDDVVVDRHWLAELATGFEIAEDVACVTGLTLPLELETPAQVWFEEYGGFTKGFVPRIFNMRDHRPPDRLFPYTAGTVGSGVNMAWRVGLLRDLGGFDPATTYTGAEDISAFFDAITHGFTLVYQPAAIVYHEHRREYEALKKQMYWYGIGLGAYLTRCVVTDPKRVLKFASRVPQGLVYMLGGSSRKNRKKSTAYPKELTRLERRGALRGAFSYLRGRRQIARENRNVG